MFEKLYRSVIAISQLHLYITTCKKWRCDELMECYSRVDLKKHRHLKVLLVGVIIVCLVPVTVLIEYYYSILKDVGLMRAVINTKGRQCSRCQLNIAGHTTGMVNIPSLLPPLPSRAKKLFFSCV